MKNSHFLTSELFRPNCTFVIYEDFEEAIEITNGTEYGLAASLFSKDEDLFHQAKYEIDCGQFNWNRSTVEQVQYFHLVVSKTLVTIDRLP